MASPSSVLTQGLGSWGSVSLIITSGFLEGIDEPGCVHPTDAAIWSVDPTDAAIWDVAPSDAALWAVAPTDEAC
jgi:hypothetical protein